MSNNVDYDQDEVTEQCVALNCPKESFKNESPSGNSRHSERFDKWIQCDICNCWYHQLYIFLIGIGYI